MSIVFILFALLGVFGFVILTITEPRAHARIRAASRRHRPLIVAIITFCAFLLLVVTDWYVLHSVHFPDWAPSVPDGLKIGLVDHLFSPFLTRIVFGLLFGIAVGYWWRSVYLRKSKDEPGFAERVTGGVMLILLVIGLFGQDVLIRAVSRINSVEAFGNKIQFAGALNDAKSAPPLALAVTPPPESAGPPDQSFGLQHIKSLDEFIKRDATYAQLIGEDSDEADQLVKLAGTLRESLRPLAVCLSRYVEVTGDNVRVSRLLAEFAAHLRQFSRERREIALSTRGALEAEQPRQQRVGSASDKWFGSARDRLVAILHEAPLPEPKSKNPEAREGCDRNAVLKFLGGNEKSFDAFFRGFLLQRDASDTRWMARPYLAIANAAMLAYDHQSVAALTVLDRWLEDQKGSTPVFSPHLGDLFVLRVRNIISQYIQEWLSGAYNVSTKRVLGYRTENLKSMSNIMDTKQSFIKMLEKNRNFMDAGGKNMALDKFRHDENYQCMDIDANSKQTEQEINTTAIFFKYYMSVKSEYIKSMLNEPNYLNDYAGLADVEADQLVAKKFKCLPKTFPAKNRNDIVRQALLIKANALNLYARVKLENRSGVRALSERLSVEETKAQIVELIRATEIGLLSIKEYRKSEPERSTVKEVFSQKVSASEADEYESALLTTRSRLLSAQDGLDAK